MGVWKEFILVDPSSREPNKLQVATPASRHPSPHSSPSTSGREGGGGGARVAEPQTSSLCSYLLPIWGPAAARRAAVAAGEDHRPA